MQKNTKPIRVLLWSIKGSGERYHGPGSFSYRLFSSAAPGTFEISLAHGDPDQPNLALFKNQYLIAPLTKNTPLQLYRFLRKSRKWLKKHAHEYDIFFGLTAFHAVVQPAYIAQGLGLPAVIFVANHNIELCDKRGLKSLLGLAAKRRTMVKKLSALIAMSEAIDKELAGYGVEPRHIFRIPMGVDTNKFQPLHDLSLKKYLRSKLGILDIPTLVFSGGLTRRKRPDLLIEAIAIAIEKGCEVQLILAGPEQNHAYVQQMKQRARALDIENRIHWLGMVEQIQTVYQAGTIFGLISDQEGMPAALVEAMACGLPAIVTPISGCTDLIVNGLEGKIVHQDRHEVAEALISYLKSPEMTRQHGERGRLEVVSRFSHIVVLNAYETLFKQLASIKDKTI